MAFKRAIIRRVGPLFWLLELISNNFEKIEEEISRLTNDQEREDLKSALSHLRAQSARHAFDAEIAERKSKALRRKLLPIKILCIAIVLFTVWWNVSLFIGGGHYTMHQKLITFADKPILYIINAVA